MLLTRATVTAASRIMLPVYPALAAWQGLAYALGDPARTNTPSFDTARSLMPMHGWGAVFLVIAALLVAGMLLGSRDVVVFVLYGAAAAYLIWSGCFAVSVFTVPQASLVAPAWPLLAAFACVASATSVARREGSG